MVVRGQVEAIAREFGLEYRWWEAFQNSNQEGELAIYNTPNCLSINFDKYSWSMRRENGLGANFEICDEKDYPSLDEIRDAIEKLAIR